MKKRRLKKVRPTKGSEIQWTVVVPRNKPAHIQPIAQMSKDTDFAVEHNVRHWPRPHPVPDVRILYEREDGTKGEKTLDWGESHILSAKTLRIIVAKRMHEIPHEIRAHGYLKYL